MVGAGVTVARAGPRALDHLRVDIDQEIDVQLAGRVLVDLADDGLPDGDDLGAERCRQAVLVVPQQADDGLPEQPVVRRGPDETQAIRVRLALDQAESDALEKVRFLRAIILVHHRRLFIGIELRVHCHFRSTPLPVMVSRSRGKFLSARGLVRKRRPPLS